MTADRFYIKPILFISIFWKFFSPQGHYTVYNTFLAFPIVGRLWGFPEFINHILNEIRETRNHILKHFKTVNYLLFFNVE